jgi:hypothetical protein
MQLANAFYGLCTETLHAEDTRLDRVVTLKFRPDEVANDPQALSRFRREAKATRNFCSLRVYVRVVGSSPHT